MTPYFQALIERSVYETLRIGLVNEGYTPDITIFPNTKAGYQDYLDALAIIEKDKGFAVELFNMGNNMDLGLKKVPRIVLAHNSIIPGSWGSAPGYMKTLKDGLYNLSKLDRVTVELYFNCSIITNQVDQLRFLSYITTLYLPPISYIPYYTENSSEDFLVKFESVQPFQDPINGLVENRYTYSIPDILLNEVVEPFTVTPIKNIQLNTYIEQKLGLTINIK